LVFDDNLATDELRCTGGYMMIRKQQYQLVEQMRKLSSTSTKSSSSDNKFDIRGQVVAVEGGRGCGKSAALHYATQYALSSGWYPFATVYLPLLVVCYFLIR
jgi:ABC-type transport system involved in cytochrome bd biosynthesis fused ATPase/permease subunit